MSQTSRNDLRGAASGRAVTAVMRAPVWQWVRRAMWAYGLPARLDDDVLIQLAPLVQLVESSRGIDNPDIHRLERRRHAGVDGHIVHPYQEGLRLGNEIIIEESRR